MRKYLHVKLFVVILLHIFNFNPIKNPKQRQKHGKCSI